MSWLLEEAKRDGKVMSFKMDISGATLQFFPTEIRTVGCAGGSERLDDADENQPVGQRLAGLQAFVNLGAYYLAWAKDNFGLLPAGKAAEDVKSLAELSSEGSRRCYLMSADENLISLRWFGWPFWCDGTSMHPPRGTISAQEWCDRAQYVVDFYAGHGVTPMEA